MWSEWIYDRMPELGDYIRVAAYGTDRIVEGHVIEISGTVVRTTDPLDADRLKAKAWRLWQPPENEILVLRTAVRGEQRVVPWPTNCRCAMVEI